MKTYVRLWQYLAEFFLGKRFRRKLKFTFYFQYFFWGVGEGVVEF
jgi:hypothetical protein